MPSVQDNFAAAFKHYKEGRLEQAETLLRRMMHRGPSSAVVMLLARVLSGLQRPEQAVFELERLIRQQPGELQPRLALGSVLISAGQNDRARPVLEESTRLHPDAAESWVARGRLGVLTGTLSEAETWLRRALELQPENEDAVVWLSDALSGMLRTREAVDLLRAFLKSNPGRLSAQQSLAFLLQYVDDASPEEILREHRLAGLLAARSVDAIPPRILVTPDPERRLTIGYLSPDFRSHSCAFFIESLLDGHDRGAVRLIAYSSTSARDAVTDRIHGKMDQWRDVRTMDDAAIASLIAADRVDIAVDLAGHSAGTRLAALAPRPAPVCVTYLGYPNTTGMPGMDYRLVDAHTDPPGAEALSSESLLRVEGCFLCYRPPERSPDVAPSPAEATRHLTFGSFNAADKISPSVAATWSRVLLSLPGSRLLLKSSKLADESARRRAVGLFVAQGIEPSRIEMLAWTADTREHLELYGRVDVALDTFPYNGTTTTCEALWMGVPVLVLEGKMHAGRVGTSLLRAVGLPELIASSPADFVRIAAELGSDRSRLAALRQGLRGRLLASELCDSPGHARRFEAVLRQAWRLWCGRATASGGPGVRSGR